MGLASLAAEFGTLVQVEAQGPDEDAALAALRHLIEVGLAQPESES
jgi:phosphotransferase system HPr-like phosphotransfer protein